MEDCTGCDFTKCRTKDHLLSHIKNGHCTILRKGDLKLIPNRLCFAKQNKDDYTGRNIAPQEQYFLPNKIIETSYGIYYITMYGLLPDGTKAEVHINGVRPYFDIKVPDGTEDSKEFMDKTIEELAGVEWAEIKKLRPLHGLHFEPVDYIRVYFKALEKRRKAIKQLKDEDELELSSDDNTYLLKVLRESKIMPSAWNKVKVIRSKLAEPNTYTHQITFYTDINGVRACKDDKDLPIDKNLLCCWDIETQTDKEHRGMIPAPNMPWYHIFMIGMAYYWWNEKKPLLKMCIVDKECRPKEGIDIIYIAENERELLTATLCTWTKMSADNYATFNGGNFDTPILIDRLKANKIYGKLAELFPNKSHVSEKTINHGFTKRPIKIAGCGYMDIILMNFPTINDVDMRIVMMKNHPTAEVKSLNGFLKLCGLDSKENMPYEVMAKIYDDSDAVRMADVAYYCLVDSMRIQDLMIHQATFINNRELSNLVQVPLFNTFYNAGGEKVKNRIAREVMKKGMTMTTNYKNVEDDQKRWYKGGMVLDPKRGLYNKDPTFAVDFTSLYPYILFCWNLSPDKIITDEAVANDLMAKGYWIHKIGPIEYSIGEKKKKTNPKGQVSGWVVRHNGVIDFKQDRIVERYEDDGQGGFTKPIYGRERMAGEQIGIIPFTVYKMLKKRVPMKRLAGKLSAMCGEMRKNNIPEMEYNGKMQSYDELSHIASLMNAKQLALKILINTIYGEMGNFKSNLYQLLVSGEITRLGRTMLIDTKNHCEEKLNCEAIYGDTDSLYMKFKPCVYKNLPSKDNWLEYCTEKVNQTIAEAKLLSKKLKVFHLNYTGTPFMNMEYEETCFPSAYLGKKCYFALPHVNKADFSPNRKLLIRGIEIIKRGQSNILRQLGNQLMQEAMSIYNDLDLTEIAEKYIKIFYERTKNADKEDLENYFISGKYNASKGGMATDFMNRMIMRKREYEDNEKCQLYEIPESGSRFNYLVVECPRNLTLQGYVIKQKKSDMVEFPAVFRYSQENDKEPMQINFNHYFDQFKTVLSRIIAYRDEFHEDSEELDDAELISEYNKLIASRAKKFIDKRVNQITGGNVIQEQNPAEQKKKYKNFVNNIYSFNYSKITIDLIIWMVETNEMITGDKLFNQIERFYPPDKTFLDYSKYWDYTGTKEELTKLQNYSKWRTEQIKNLTNEFDLTVLNRIYNEFTTLDLEKFNQHGDVEVLDKYVWQVIDYLTHKKIKAKLLLGENTFKQIKDKDNIKSLTEGIY